MKINYMHIAMFLVPYIPMRIVAIALGYGVDVLTEALLLIAMSAVAHIVMALIYRSVKREYDNAFISGAMLQGYSREEAEELLEMYYSR